MFSNAVYLETIYDQVMWLVTENIPMHRRAIQIPGGLPRVLVDSSFSVRERHLLLGYDIDFDLSTASKWVLPRPNLDQILPMERLQDRLRTVSSLFDDFPTPKGFGKFLLEIERIASGNPFPVAFTDYGPALKYAWPMLDEIVRACMVNDCPQILKIAEDLIGLGEGLTPSGDDFIGGLLFANFMLQQIYPQYQGISLSDVELSLDNSKNQTNLISYTILEDLAAGHAAEVLHHFINAVLTNTHLESIYYLGLELVRIGHSTGWDLLSGVWTGMLLSIGSQAALSCSVPAFKSSGY